MHLYWGGLNVDRVLFDPHEEGNFVTWTDDCIVFGDLVVSDSMLQVDELSCRVSDSIFIVYG